MIKLSINLFKSVGFFFTVIFKVFKFILMLTGIMSLIRCSSGYKKEGDKVFFDGKEVGKDFKVLNDVFAKDDSAAYFKHSSIAGADIATFTALDMNYAKDKNAVYYCDEFREGVNYYLTKRSTITHVEFAEPASFMSMGNGYTGYAKDNRRGYFQGVGFPVQDVASLEIIEAGFLKDKQKVYYNQTAIKGSDPKSFRVLNLNYAQDAAQVYFFSHEEGVEVMPCNSQTFVLLDYPYSKDATAVFYVNAVMHDVDAKTFSILGNNFSKDKQQVFFEDKKIIGADASTFMVSPEYAATTQELYFAKDNAHFFWKDTKVNGADAASFKAIDFAYATDGSHIFFKTVLIKDADPNSFKVYPHGVGDADAEDKNNKFAEGKKVAQ